MYTKEETDGLWVILDPDGDVISPAMSKEYADGLLTHLNR